MDLRPLLLNDTIVQSRSLRVELNPSRGRAFGLRPSAFAALPRLDQPRRVARHLVDLDVDRVARIALAQVVTSSVCGISRTSNSSPSTALTVSDAPSSATEPLTAMNFASAPGARKRKCAMPSKSRRDTIVGEAVDMAADHVAAKLVADPQGALEIDLRPLAPAAERGHRKRLRADVEGEPRALAERFDGDDGQAHAGVGDRGADRDRRGS